MLSGFEFSFTFCSKLCRRGENFICPLQKFFFRKFISTDIVTSWLKDCHYNIFNIINAVKQCQSTKCITHHLRILLCFHQYTDSIFKVNHCKNVVRNNNAVARTESLRYPFWKIQFLFHKDDRVFAKLLCFFNSFWYILLIAVCAVSHFSIKVRKIFSWVFSIFAEQFL